MTTHAPYEGPLPEGWNGGAPVTKRWNGDFIHLYRVTRPCATCTAEISIDVTKNALQGFKKNAGLLLRNCPTCRAERKAGGPGSRGGKSRPVCDSSPPDPANELETLRMANNVMREELEGLYVTVAELQGRLALYELPAAMVAANNETKPLTKSFPWA